MALKNIQNLMLNVVINHNTLHDVYRNPDKYQAEFALTDEEIGYALQMPRRAIGAFNISLVFKRLRRSHARQFVVRTLGYMSNGQKGNVIRSFTGKYNMRQNDWMERVGDFLDHAEQETFGERSKADLVNIDIIAFERWVYNLYVAGGRGEVASGSGYVLAPSVKVEKFPFPATPLISTDTTESNFALLNKSHGQDGYVLGQYVHQGNLKDVDLYEIDNCYYQLLKQCETPKSNEQFHQIAQTIAQDLGVERTSEEMLQELLELGILIQQGEVI